MVAGTLRARLTTRLLVLTGVVLVGVGISAVLVTQRVLDESDTALARSSAASAPEALQRELDEGDSNEAAAEQVVDATASLGVRLTLRFHDSAATNPTEPPLTSIPSGECGTVIDEHQLPWRVCAHSGDRVDVAAAVPLAAHRSTVLALWRGVGLVVAVAMLALWLAINRALRAPIQELTSLVDWTGRIADTEEPGEAPEARTREVAQLQRAFESVLRRLLEVLARERANSAHIAHELRTPLTSILAGLDGLSSQDPATRAVVVGIRGDVARLTDVIEAVLVLSAGPTSTRRGAPFNLADMVRELAPSDARIDAPDEALIEGDERLVRLALRNLVDNATKYGKGVRLIRVLRERDVVRVSVVDHGSGLDEEACRRMFQRYWRASAEGEGRGLGLALVSAVAQQHGGGAEAQRASGDLGLDVSFTLAPLVRWHRLPSSSSVG